MMVSHHRFIRDTRNTCRAYRAPDKHGRCRHSAVGTMRATRHTAASARRAVGAVTDRHSAAPPRRVPPGAPGTSGVALLRDPSAGTRADPRDLPLSTRNVTAHVLTPSVTHSFNRFYKFLIAPLLDVFSNCASLCMSLTFSWLYSDIVCKID